MLENEVIKLRYISFSKYFQNAMFRVSMFLLWLDIATPLTKKHESLLFCGKYI